MIAILEERYFEWLYAHVSDPTLTQPHSTHWKLLRQLHKKEFVYIVANDDNRWLDGRDLRSEFRAEVGGEELPTLWLGLACSMLEMLVALSRRLEFQTDEDMNLWFWRLLDNLRIAEFDDSRYNETTEEIVDTVLDRVIWRSYTYSGRGGLFPLARADRDQRKLEIWFQMHSYLLEAL